MMDLQTHKIKMVLKEQLKKNKITYDDLADELEVSVPTIKRWMGDADIGLTDLIRICDVLNLNLGDLQALTEKIQGDKNANALTEEQQKFFVKNPNFFAYFIKIMDGMTPEQIAEKFKLTKLSTDKYLVRLEKLGVIRVTGKFKVKPTIPGSLNLGFGSLSKAYYRQTVMAGGTFFVDAITEAIYNESIGSEQNKKQPVTYGLQRLRLTRESYDKWTKQHENALSQLAAISDIEEKAYDEKDLLSTVIINAHCSVPNDYKGFKTIDEAFGKIENL